VGEDIHSHKGVNLPSSTLRMPFFTEKERKNPAFGLQQGVDFVALSFVRHEKDIEPVREMLAKAHIQPFLIAKIEKPRAIERMEAILAEADGVMVARGELYYW